MPDFVAVLAIYYLCSSEADRRALSVAEAQGCAAIYEQVKVPFRPKVDPPPTEARARADRNRSAYIAFKRWETAHPAVVCPLKRQARMEPHKLLTNDR